MPFVASHCVKIVCVGKSCYSYVVERYPAPSYGLLIPIIGNDLVKCLFKNQYAMSFWDLALVASCGVRKSRVAPLVYERKGPDCMGQPVRVGDSLELEPSAFSQGPILVPPLGQTMFELQVPGHVLTLRPVCPIPHSPSSRWSRFQTPALSRLQCRHPQEHNLGPTRGSV